MSAAVFCEPLLVNRAERRYSISYLSKAEKKEVSKIAFGNLFQLWSSPWLQN